MQESLEISFKKICDSLGWKATVQRFYVYKAMFENKTHPSVEDVCKIVRNNIPNITQDSIYRILQDFSNANIFKQINGNSLIKFDYNTKDHSHFICKKCGKMIDINLDINLKEIADKIGVYSDIELRICGICEDCLKKESTR